MTVLHDTDPRPTAPRDAAPRPSAQRAAITARRAGRRHPLAVLALAPILVASCTDDIAANCPPLAHPEVLTVAAAAGNPCAATAGESAPAGWGQPKGGER